MSWAISFVDIASITFPDINVDNKHLVIESINFLIVWHLIKNIRYLKEYSMGNACYTLKIKRNITSLERYSLKSNAPTSIIFGNR